MEALEAEALQLRTAMIHCLPGDGGAAMAAESLSSEELGRRLLAAFEEARSAPPSLGGGGGAEALSLEVEFLNAKVSQLQSQLDAAEATVKKTTERAEAESAAHASTTAILAQRDVELEGKLEAERTRGKEYVAREKAAAAASLEVERQ